MCRETRSEELVDDGGDHGDHDEVGKQLHGVDGLSDIAAATGFMMGAARRGIPVVVDGLIASAEALMAEELAPGASAWMVAGHVSTEPGCALAQRRLHLAPILDLEMRLGEGTGAVLAVPILEASGAALRDIAALADLS